MEMVDTPTRAPALLACRMNGDWSVQVLVPAMLIGWEYKDWELASEYQFQ
jgi:hypothetical protein